jgi:hypothetical protein
VTELIHLAHTLIADDSIADIAADQDMYKATGGFHYTSQAEVALRGLSKRRAERRGIGLGTDKALLQCLRVLTQQEAINLPAILFSLENLFSVSDNIRLPYDSKMWAEFLSLTRQLADRIEKQITKPSKESGEEFRTVTRDEGLPAAILTLREWANRLERAMAEGLIQEEKLVVKGESRTPAKRAAKKAGKGRKRR